MNIKRVFVIAEIGVNHNGSIDLAKKMIDIAVNAGADAVKFQSFVTEEELVKRTPKAAYQKKMTDSQESQFDMIKKLELNKEQHYDLMAYCQEKSIEFMSSPFDLKSVALLAELDINRIKIPSGEITNVPYLEAIAKLNKPVVMSSGMAYLEEVEFAIKILLNNGLLRDNISILHCTSDYPAPMDDVNLNVLTTLKEIFNLPIGYSDHTLGSEVSVAAVALGASIIEKHITLDKTLQGPDHAASMEYVDFKAMIKQIRNIERALGSFDKKPSEQEKATREVVRKRIVAKKAIRQGDVLSVNNLTTKRAPDGHDAKLWNDLLGKISPKDYVLDDAVDYER